MTFLTLLYVGPDQLLPVASTVGGLIGVVLLWWHRILGFFRKPQKPAETKPGDGAPPA